ncbi:MAG: cytochrome c3 family protein [Thermogutta sp.]|nr:cytochrome c3 family protein [Thermogutta sp.]HPU05087.1 cytochrome c3 family protein [Thermogutta sp.]HQF12736.1 cytochrome c3 family protein [Thermogutta sp.]
MDRSGLATGYVLFATLVGFLVALWVVFAITAPRSQFVWAGLSVAEEKGTVQEKAPPDNSPCFVCHANFEDEPLSTRHFKAKIGCVDCHGESLAHRSDENNTTPPDKMYAPDEIDPACKSCHKNHNASAREVVEVYLERCREITDPKKLTCTNCHGRHRMYHRTIVWDKRTGKLITPTESTEDPHQSP